RGDNRRRDFLGAAVNWVRDFGAKNSAESRAGPRRTGSVQPDAGIGLDAGKRRCEAGQRSRPSEHVLRALSFGSGAAARAEKTSGNCGSARADIAARRARRVRPSAGAAFQYDRATAVHKSAGDGGEGREAGEARGGGRERFVGRHFEDGDELVVEHYRGGEFSEDKRDGPGEGNWNGLGKNAGAAASVDAGDFHAFWARAGVLSGSACAAVDAEGNRPAA